MSRTAPRARRSALLLAVGLLGAAGSAHAVEGFDADVSYRPLGQPGPGLLVREPGNTMRVLDVRLEDATALTRRFVVTDTRGFPLNAHEGCANEGAATVVCSTGAFGEARRVTVLIEGTRRSTDNVTFENTEHAFSSTVDLGRGNDRFTGGPGSDTVTGGDGRDDLFGRGGNDTLMGDDPQNSDTLRDEDFIEGGPGADVIHGGRADDQVFGSDFGVVDEGDVIDGDEGVDSTGYRGRTQPVQVRLDGQPGDGAAGEGDNIVEVERVAGTDRADVLIGSPLGDELDGEGDDDIVIGLGGDDELDGGPGDDHLADEEGSTGGGDDTLRGGPGDDVMLAGRGDDDLLGAADDDMLSGDRGDDRLFAGEGADVLGGGFGSDLLVARESAAETPGADTVRCGSVPDGPFVVGVFTDADRARVDGLDVLPANADCEVVDGP